MVHKEILQVKLEEAELNRLRFSRIQEYFAKKSMERIDSEVKKFHQFQSTRDEMKKDRIRTLYTAEQEKHKIREALYEMAVQKVYDPQILYEISRGKKNDKNQTIAGIVRNKASQFKMYQSTSSKGNDTFVNMIRTKKCWIL